MTPKEKALELACIMRSKFDYMVEYGDIKEAAKDCALIAVNEVIDKDGYNNEYWQEVKQEINKL
jgi:hypothetical protein